MPDALAQTLRKLDAIKLTDAGRAGGLVVATLALALLALYSALVGPDPYRQSLPYVIVFGAIGFRGRPGTSLRMAPLLLAAYTGPLVVTQQSAWAIGSVLYVVPLCVVVGELVSRLAARMRDAEDRYQALFEHAPRGMYQAAPDGRLLDANTELARMLGHGSRAELLASASHFKQFFNDPSRHAAFLALLTERGSVQEFESLVQRKDGKLLWIAESGRALLDTYGRPRHYLSTVEDVTQRRETEETLVHQAFHDALTGLPNRTLLYERMDQAILMADRSERPLALLVMDLDLFKEVNDTLGHQAGDLLLQEVAHRVHASRRSADTVARLGGDEFAILLPTVDGVRGATLAAERFLEAFREPFSVEDHELTVGASFGIALYPAHAENVSTLLRRADLAMYAAKRNKTGYAVYESEQDRDRVDRLHLKADLSAALERSELLLHYQPVAQFDGTVTHVEALARWQHPQRGLLPPGLFVPLAEQTGMIGALTRWVLNAALRQCREWLDRDLSIPVSVNISAYDLQQRLLPDAIARLLAEWQVPSSQLILEVTETSLIGDLRAARVVLKELKKIGVRVAIDDFGTGYASLSHLKCMPMDDLKIDRSLVKESTTSENDVALVQTIIDLAHNLKLRVVAEGVEDRATWTLLSQLGCDLAQGFYIGRPVGADQITHVLARILSLPAAATPSDWTPSLSTSA